MRKLVLILAFFSINAIAQQQVVTEGPYIDQASASAACDAIIEIGSCPTYGFAGYSVARAYCRYDGTRCNTSGGSQNDWFRIDFRWNHDGCPADTEPDSTGLCVEPEEPDPLDDVDRCMDAIAASGGNGHWVQDETGWDCHVGLPRDEPACSIADNSIGTGACMAAPTPDPDITKRCEEGFVYGEINNVGVCVQSAGSNYAGSSDPMTWGSMKEGQPQVAAQTERTTSGLDDNGDVITTTTEETTTETDIVRTEPAPQRVPYRCEDGRLAADMASCDSAKSCPANHYLAYGACIPVPAEEITDKKEETTRTVTRTNETTNQTTTETSESTTTRPGQGGGGVGRVRVEIGKGPCDPTAANYLQCVAGEGSDKPAHTDNGDKTMASVNQEFFQRVNESPLVTAMGSVANVFPNDTGSCPALTMDLSGVPLIGEVVSTNVHCQLAEEIRPVLLVVMNLLWVIVCFRIFASA